MTDLALVLGLLGLAVVLLALGRPRMDAVAAMMIVALPLLGVITVEQALAGFADPNVILIGALFVIGEALVRTGVTQSVGDWLVRCAGRSEARLIVLLMVVVAGIGSFMSSTGVVAIFIPIVLRIARSTRIPASRLMMPLSVAALLSGMMTLVATAPNLVVQGEIERQGLEGFGFFDFTPFGLPLLGIAILYMLAARRFLGRGDEPPRQAERPTLKDLIETYGLQGREFRFAVLPASPLVGHTLAELDLRGSAGANIIAIERTQRFSTQFLRPQPFSRLEAGDVLMIDDARRASGIEQLADRFGLRPLAIADHYFSDRRQEIGMAEVLVSPYSRLAGRTVVEARFRSLHDLAVIGIRRAGEALDDPVAEVKLRAGDTLLVIGPWPAIERLPEAADRLILLDTPVERDDVAPLRSRAPYAVAIVLLTVAAMASGALPNVTAALLGCLLLGLAGCMDMTTAYRSIHWQTLLLIVGMLPFAAALEATGGAALAAEWLLRLAGPGSPQLLLAALFVATALLGLFISNTATAVLMAPVAISLAGALDASPYPFAMTVALAASAAFMTPVSSPVNVLVVGPGNYRFTDFVRIGVPLTLLMLLATSFLVPMMLPLR